MTTKATQPDDLRGVIHLRRPKCVRCGSSRLKVYGGYDLPAGGRMQYAECRTCGAKHKIFWD